MLSLKSKRQSLIILLVLLSILLACLGTYQLIFHGCLWWNCAPTRDFGVLDLNLPDYLFTPDTKIEKLRWLRNDISVDPAIAYIRWANGDANYSIRRFPTTDQASRDYEFQIKSNMFTEVPMAADQVQDILDYVSEVADKSNIQCGYVLQDFRCIYTAQYQEFVINFNSTIELNGMPNIRYLDILKYIDNMMFTFLGEHG